MTSNIIDQSVVTLLDNMMRQRLREDIHVVVTKYGDHHVVNHTTDDLVLMDIPDRDLADWICDGINMSDGARRETVVNQVRNIWQQHRASIHRSGDQVKQYNHMISQCPCDEVIYSKLAHAEHRLNRALDKMERQLRVLFMVNRKRSSFRSTV